MNMILYLLAGAAGAAALFVAAMRMGMIRKYRMHARFEDVCENIEKAVKSVDGWGHPIPDWDFHQVVSKQHYFDNLKKKKIFFVCKAKYANRIVDRFPHMGAMMPCTWSVYETADGKVYVAKMNIALMSKMFLGNVIGSTMSLVASEEHNMIRELRRLLGKRAAA
ncbi:MAG TPA: DUF302 domain-containing protein [Kiritimatiellia bacterium]|nr:DUF302 domain-containing protein [Kiritimatiellia bacterium]HQQ04641.1 DUF302 domain-containing protein [Kiritimatiellia bacterium]